MTYKLSLGLKREEIIHDLKLVREGIIDEDSYQKADAGLILSNLDDIIEMCEEAKSVQTVDTVKHAHWILKGWNNGDCSACKENVDFPLMCYYDSPSTRYEPYPYCPWCNAKMDLLYKGEEVADWYDPEMRTELVKEYGWICSEPDINECKECQEKNYCEYWGEGLVSE